MARSAGAPVGSRGGEGGGDGDFRALVALILRCDWRLLDVPQKLWSCERCRDPDTGEAMRFVDASLSGVNHALADDAWREHFGEPLPPGQKPGRKAAAPLEERVIAMLSKSELARLDAARGERSRSEFLRDAARRLVEAVEQQKAG
jgi:Ribbon-helix-helix protein, copG family